MVIHPYAMGRLSWLWENPLQFNPNRFLKFDESSHKFTVQWPHPSKLLAFNLNPRYCLGKKVAILEGKVSSMQICSEITVFSFSFGFSNNFYFYKKKERKKNEKKTHKTRGYIMTHAAVHNTCNKNIFFKNFF